jgi:hypothetical protein
MLKRLPILLCVLVPGNALAQRPSAVHVTLARVLFSQSSQSGVLTSLRRLFASEPSQ